MYATPHTLAGLGTLLITKSIVGNSSNVLSIKLPFIMENPFTLDIYLYYIIGIPLAVITHILLDYINERGLTTDDRLNYDIYPSLSGYLVAILSGQFWLLFISNVSGNLPDLIDKKGYLTIFFPTKFKATKYLHKQVPIIDPSPKLTKIIGLVSALIIIIILIINKSYDIRI